MTEVCHNCKGPLVHTFKEVIPDMNDIQIFYRGYCPICRETQIYWEHFIRVENGYITEEEHDTKLGKTYYGED